MFDIGGWELLVIAALALIVVGPKDLPRLIRSAGQWVGRARSLARDFQSGMEQAAREADLDDEVRTLKDAKSGFGKSVAAYDRDLRSVTGGKAGAPTKAAPASAAAPPGPAARPTPVETTSLGAAPARASAAAAPTAAARSDDALLDDFGRGVRGED